MYKPVSFFIGLRYLWNPYLPKFKKVMTVLSVMSISITVFSFIIVVSIMNGFENNFKKNILSFVPHLIITNKNKYIHKSEFPKSILNNKSIEKISDFINKEVIINSNNAVTIGEIIGVDVSNDDNISNYNVKNILYTLKSGKYNAIIGKKLSQKLHVNIGDKIKLIVLSDKKDCFSGKIYNKSYFKITGFFSTDNEVDYYQILINRKDSLKFLGYSKNYITGWRLWLKDPLLLKINKVKNLKKKLLMFDWTSEKGELFKAIQIEKYAMLFLFSLIFLVASFSVISIFSTYIVEKQNSVAILRTQGLSQGKIMLIFIILGSSISLIGSAFGTIFSVFLIIENNLLNFFINFFSDVKIPIIIVHLQIFFINIASILITNLSILYPVLHSIKLTPAKILSYE